MLALILLSLLALGIALLDDASGPSQASSSSIPTSTSPVSQTAETRASVPTSGAAGIVTAAASPAPARSGSAGSSSLAGDKVPPLTPTFTQTPPDPSANATSKFAWMSTDPAPGSGISHYLCSTENRGTSSAARRTPMTSARRTTDSTNSPSSPSTAR